MARTTEPLTLTSFRRLDQWTSVCYLPKLLAESGQYFQHERIIRIDEVRRMKLPVFRICGQKKVHRTDVTLAMIKLMVGATWFEHVATN